MDRLIVGLTWEEAKRPGPVSYRVTLYGDRYEELANFTFTESKDFPELTRPEIVEKIATKDRASGGIVRSALDDDTAIYMDGSLVSGTPKGMRP